MSGRKVRTLAGAAAAGGRLEALTWDGRDQAGARLGAGVYFLRLAAPGFTESVKVQKVR